MEIRIVHYDNREHVTEGVRKLFSEGWLLQTLTNFHSGAARAEFVRAHTSTAAAPTEQPKGGD